MMNTTNTEIKYNILSVTDIEMNDKYNEEPLYKVELQKCIYDQINDFLFYNESRNYRDEIERFLSTSTKRYINTLKKEVQHFQEDLNTERLYSIDEELKEQLNKTLDSYRKMIESV